ncbi:Target of rapamycin complex subunit lst8, partial [Mortierella sp. NVP85]
MVHPSAYPSIEEPFHSHTALLNGDTFGPTHWQERVDPRNAQTTTAQYDGSVVIGQNIMTHSSMYPSKGSQIPSQETHSNSNGSQLQNGYLAPGKAQTTIAQQDRSETPGKRRPNAPLTKSGSDLFYMSPLQDAHVDPKRARMKTGQPGKPSVLTEDGMVCSCAYSPDGMSIAVGLDDGSINVYSTEDWSMTWTLSGHAEAVWRVVYSPAGDRIASASQDRTVCIWDSGTGSLLHTCSHDGGVYCVAFSPRGNKVASASEDQTVKLWEVETGNCLQALPDHHGGATCVAFSPTGKQIASGCGNSKVRLWNAGGRSHELSGHSQPVRDVKYSSEGDHIASASDDRTVRLWNAKTRACRYILTGHDYAVLCVAFSPKGDQLASGSADKT